MMYTLEFKIHFLPRRTNNSFKSNWRASAAEAKKWNERVYDHVRFQLPPKPLQKATVTLTRHSSSEPDYDGLVSSFKHCIDGLVKAGVLENDKPSNIGQPIYKWQRCPALKGHITIQVVQI